MTTEPTRMLRGANVLRVVWLPGTDKLRGICHCGASHEADDPAVLWEWLLAHPVGHEISSQERAFRNPLPPAECDVPLILLHT